MPRCARRNEDIINHFAPRTLQSARDYIARETEFGAMNYKPLDIVLKRGEGVYVWDVDGRRYLDCLAAYSAVNQGHCHPRILAALIEQAPAHVDVARLPQRSTRAFQKNCTLTRAHMVLPMNSGAEAVETALKRRANGATKSRASPRARQRSSSATTISTAAPSPSSVSPPTRFARRLRPLHARLHDCSVRRHRRAGSGHHTEYCGVSRRAHSRRGRRDDPARRLSEGGADLCARENVLLIPDEIQTGLGRTGRMLADEHEGVEADLTLLGKALAGGFYPVSAVLSNTEGWACFIPASMARLTAATRWPAPWRARR